MKKVIILKGLPASGKSTWAKNLVNKHHGRYKRINKDDLRAMLDDSKWSKDNEKFILTIRDQLILAALEDGKHVIVDDTNLHPKHEERIRQITKGLATVEVKVFDTSLKVCIERDLKRPNSVGEKVIKGMYNQFMKPEVEQYVPDTEAQCAWIFDIDGTLARMGARTPYGWDLVGGDSLNESVRDVLHALQAEGAAIIIFTGRDGVCEEETKVWLTRYGITYDHFAIRPEGNTECDSIIKKRMFDEIKDKYNVLGVFDDRPRVIRMWRELGLKVFDVGDGIDF